MQLSKLPGNNISPAVNEAINKAICIYIGRTTSIDSMLKNVMKLINTPRTNNGYLNAFKFSIGVSILT
ncbi:hypothetical protein D3C77_559770 [compost metagenome]